MLVGWVVGGEVHDLGKGWERDGGKDICVYEGRGSGFGGWVTGDV